MLCAAVQAAVIASLLSRNHEPDPPDPPLRVQFNTGSNYAPTFDYFESESARTFKPKSYKESVKIKAVGLRSEEMLFVG